MPDRQCADQDGYCVDRSARLDVATVSHCGLDYQQRFSEQRNRDPDVS